MIITRMVFQAKVGMGDELATRIVASSPPIAQGLTSAMGGPPRWRVLTDLSGPLDTVVLEIEIESLAALERMHAELPALPPFHEYMSQVQDLVAGGHNELWRVEGEG